MLDIELVKHCQEGDLYYFGTLYDRYIDNIYKFIYIKIGDKEISEDLTSEVFMKSLNCISSFRIKPGATFKSWIYKIAYNRVIDYYRTKKDNLGLEDYMNLGKIVDFGKTVDDKEKLQKVLKYLFTIKKEYRVVIIMRVWDNLSYKEISEITGMSVVNCKQIFCRETKKIDPNIILLILLFINL